jgi:hypothetical protein
VRLGAKHEEINDLTKDDASERIQGLIAARNARPPSEPQLKLLQVRATRQQEPVTLIRVMPLVQMLGHNVVDLRHRCSACKSLLCTCCICCCAHLSLQGNRSLLSSTSTLALRIKFNARSILPSSSEIYLKTIVNYA